MNEEPNPYAPPAIHEEPHLSGSPDSGRLWRVMDGQLEVRHLASLPNVCVAGSQEGESGAYQSTLMPRVILANCRPPTSKSCVSGPAGWSRN